MDEATEPAGPQKSTRETQAAEISEIVRWALETYAQELVVDGARPLVDGAIGGLVAVLADYVERKPRGTEEATIRQISRNLKRMLQLRRSVDRQLLVPPGKAN